MTFSEWVSKQPQFKGWPESRVAASLSASTGLALNTVKRALSGAPLAPRTAERLAGHTGGAVDVGALVWPVGAP